MLFSGARDKYLPIHRGVAHSSICFVLFGGKFTLTASPTCFNCTGGNVHWPISREATLMRQDFSKRSLFLYVGYARAIVLQLEQLGTCSIAISEDLFTELGFWLKKPMVSLCWPPLARAARQVSTLCSKILESRMLSFNI